MFAGILIYASILANLLELIYRYFFLPIKLFIIYLITALGIPF